MNLQCPKTKSRINSVGMSQELPIVAYDYREANANASTKDYKSS